MSTLADVAAQVASDLKRSTLGTDITAAIIAAVKDHDTRRFWFNTTATYLSTFTNGSDVFTIAPQAPILEFIRIDKVRSRDGGTTGSWYSLKVANFDTVDVLRSNPSSGQPARWARVGNTLEIWPTANKDYSLKIYGHYRLIALAAPTDTNVWTNEGFQLIRYTALKRLAAFPERNADLMQMAEAMGVRELEYLRSETEKRARSGRMKAYG